MHWLTASKKANILPCECFCLLIPVYGKDANNCCTVYNKQAVHSSFAQSKRWTQACTLPYVMPMQQWQSRCFCGSDAVWILLCQCAAQGSCDRQAHRCADSSIAVACRHVPAHQASLAPSRNSFSSNVVSTRFCMAHTARLPCRDI